MPRTGPTTPPPAFAISFDRDLDALHRVRALVGDALAADAPARLVADAQLVVNELVGNVLAHTPGGGEVRLLPSARALRIEVDDTTNEPPVLIEAPGSTRPFGRGMQIVVGVVSAWGVEWRRPRGKTVWAELPLDGVERSRPDV